MINRNINTYITNIKFKNSLTTYESFVKCTIKDYEFNLSYNPTLLSGSQAGLYTYNYSSGSIIDPNTLYEVSSSNNYGILKDFVTASISGSDFSPYVGSIGLYNDAGELLAVAKMAAPMPVAANTDMTFLVKYDTKIIPKPYFTPSPSPTATPSVTPSVTPSISVSATPSQTPSVTPSVTPSTSISATPSVTPSITPSISLTPSITPSTSISATPSVTPSITPSITPSPSRSLFTISYNVRGGSGGRLRVVDALSAEIISIYSSGTIQSGTITLNANQVPYTIYGEWTNGSGNIVRYRVCDLNGGEIFYSDDITNLNSPVDYYASPTPYNINIYLTSGVSNTPFFCPIGEL